MTTSNQPYLEGLLPINDGIDRPRKHIHFSPLKHPVWTENKSKLIERYLYYFVMITRHGTYIDGFSGPQNEDKSELCAAKLVLETPPYWLRNFHLFELESKKIPFLEALRDSQPTRDSKGNKLNRKVEVYQGDFNELVLELLARKTIRDKEATFCLLDQRTFECKWNTVKALAEYKPSDQNKIELFYFLPNSWQDRALAGLSANPHLAIEWWGQDVDVAYLKQLGSAGRRETMVKRFAEELGYRHVAPWPIYSKQKGSGTIMYYMIHATDHDEAPKLMQRAYNQAIAPPETIEQLKLEFGL